MNNEHENWVRHHSIEQAIRINKRNQNIEKIIDDARKITGFVLNKQADLEVIKEVAKK